MKPATDLPEDMMRRVRAAAMGYSAGESHVSTPTALPGQLPTRKSSRAATHGSAGRHKTKQRCAVLPMMGNIAPGRGGGKGGERDGRGGGCCSLISLDVLLQHNPVNYHA